MLLHQSLPSSGQKREHISLTLFSGELATLLQEATVSIINHKTCNKMYDDAVTPRMICAGNIQGGVDACQVSRSFCADESIFSCVTYICCSV